MKNMHKSRRARIEEEAKEDRTKRAAEHPQLGTNPKIATGAGPALGKTLVQAVLERDGEVRAQILETFGTLERANVDEEAWRFNQRKTNDGQRFIRAMAMVPSARLTYAQLIRRPATPN